MAAPATSTASPGSSPLSCRHLARLVPSSRSSVPSSLHQIQTSATAGTPAALASAPRSSDPQLVTVAGSWTAVVVVSSPPFN